jgi:glycosyltransferase involved in cell wall biosynthesis
VSASAFVIPVLDEEQALPRLVGHLRKLDPQPDEIVVVDGGSSDRTRDIVRDAGWRLVEAPRGRAVQINAGVEASESEIVCVLHADTLPPTDAVAVIASVMADRRTALAGFTPLIRGAKIRWGTSFHNWIKTWYAPLLFRPHLFVRGVRLLFGDHAMFFRRADFMGLGGCDPGMPVMEDADLSIKFARLGRVRLVPRIVETSDRRITAWGPLRANWIYLKVGVMWAFGARKRLARHYPDIR